MFEPFRDNEGNNITSDLILDVGLTAMTGATGLPELEAMEMVGGAAKVERTASLASEAKLVNTVNAAKTGGRATTTVLSDVTVISKGKVVGQGDVYLRSTLEGIESGKIAPRDIFQNREGLLPSKGPGYYQEFVHPTPGVSGAGSQRIIRGAGGELYYTPDHYGSFVPLN